MLLALGGVPQAGGAAAQEPELGRSLRQAQVMHGHKLGVPRPAGITYSGESGQFLVLPGLEASPGRLAPRLAERVTAFRDRAGSVALPAAVAEPAAVAYDARGRRLLALDVATRSLWAIPGDGGGGFDSDRAVRLEAPRAGPLKPLGMAVDPASGDVFVLDRLTRRVLWFAPTTGEPGGDAIPVARWIELGPLAALDLSGLALHPGTGNLFILERARRALHEIGPDGSRIASYDVSSVRFADPRGMVFAPSGDQTDDPSALSLYVADAGAPTGNHGHVVEVSWASSVAAVVASTSLTGTVVRTTLTSQFSPPCPDPSGITYDSSTGRLVISDGEVDEMTIWAGKNVFETSLTGTLLRGYDVTGYTHEPTGTAFNPNNGQLFVTDDDQKRVFKVNPGPDGLAGTGDDAVTWFSTTPFGAGDPEGCAYDRVNNRLFLADGQNAEVYVLRPGPNGVIDGVVAPADDQVTHFDTAVLGLIDLETVEYNEAGGTLFLLGRTNKFVLETTDAGAPVSQIDLGCATLSNPAGLAYGPSSGSASMSFYIVNRAVDNDTDPNENDGTLVEVTLGGSGSGSGTDFRVATGSDDAEESAGGSVSVTGSDLELVYDGSNQTVGVRFTNLPIPPGASITNAYIQFEAKEVQSVATSLILQGQAADHAATFTTASGNVSSRPRTAASVSWSPPPWSTLDEAGIDQRTPDLSGVIQEIVNRPGWTIGNALAIIITGTGHRTARSYEGKACGAPRLHVEFGEGVPPTNRAPVVSAGPDQAIVLPDEAVLDGTVADDGLPSPPAVTIAWSLVSGPGTVTFQNPSAADTRAAFSDSGTYVLSLTASDGELSTTDEVTILAQPVWTPITLERRIAAGSDDAEESSSGSVNLSGGGDIELVYDKSNQRVGLRFASVTIPRGATIQSAYIQFQADEARSEVTSLLIQGQASGNASTFTRATANVSSRPRTASSVSWSPPTWSIVGETGAKQRTPELKSVIEEIINRPDWASGNALAAIITGTGRRTARAFEQLPAGAALLHVRFVRPWQP